MNALKLLVQNMEEWIVDGLVVVIRSFCNE
jgi:benzoyl-CoA reductase/2-hydroxyglutaryl-CoA dehydratase subunit BcrC/BadD/HgdB